MLFNKDIITRIITGLIIFAIFAKVVVPLFMSIIRKKIPGSYEPESDIDSMIRRQKERLKSQYGITGASSTAPPTSSEAIVVTKEVEDIYKESRWGGGETAKGIQTTISKNYSYVLAESKINAFILLAEKRNYLRFLSADNQKSPEAIKNFLSLLMLVLILVDEIKNKETNLIEKVAKKAKISPAQFSLALQLKILFTIKAKKEVKDERLYSASPVLHLLPDETLKDAIDTILGREANFWAKGHSSFFEELALYFSYADILSPPQRIKDKKDLEGAYRILKVNEDMEMDEIKKVYKKLAMTSHPDKIGQLKLPPLLEKKAIQNFNHIQEAYDLITSYRKK